MKIGARVSSRNYRNITRPFPTKVDMTWETSGNHFVLVFSCHVMSIHMYCLVVPIYRRRQFSTHV